MKKSTREPNLLLVVHAHVGRVLEQADAPILAIRRFPSRRFGRRSADAQGVDCSGRLRRSPAACASTNPDNS